MSTFIKRLQKISFASQSVPLALLAGMLLAYGLISPWLGFYQDDWNLVYYAYARGTNSLWELLSYDGRPFAAWAYIAGFAALGFKPLAWQLGTLALRWLCTSMLWAVLNQVWPRQVRQTFSAALIFGLYPFFTLQPLAVTFWLHWTGYLFFAVSLWLMLKAAQQPARFWLFTGLALLAEAAHLLGNEYFSGLELVRPLLLWFVISGADTRQKAWRTARQWLPYLALLLVYFAWRGFLYQSPDLTRSSPGGLQTLIGSPLSAISEMLLNLLPDLVMVLVSGWASLLNPAAVDFHGSINLLFMAISLLGAAGLYGYLRQLSDTQLTPDARWKRQALLLGLAALLFGLLPAYAAGYFINTKIAPWNQRFAMGPMFGAGLLVMLALESLISSARARRLLLALLMGLAIGAQLRSGNEFRHAWQAQSGFYQQLSLRAPGLAEHTAILVDDEFLGLMGDYPTSFALNSLYATPGSVSGREARTWLFVVNSNFGGRIEGLLAGMPLQDSKHSTTFAGSSTQSLVLRYEPDLGECLWLITPQNADMPQVPEMLRALSRLSNTDLIDAQAGAPAFAQLILPVEAANWCDYYQRGALAQQERQWQQAAQLWQRASEEQYHPSNGFEMLPFIEAFGQSGQWAQAFELTRSANRLSKGMQPSLCSLWARLKSESMAAPARDLALQNSIEFLNCP